MGGGVQPIRSFTSCSTATPIRLAITRPSLLTPLINGFLGSEFWDLAHRAGGDFMMGHEDQAASPDDLSEQRLRFGQLFLRHLEALGRPFLPGGQPLITAADYPGMLELGGMLTECDHSWAANPVYYRDTAYLHGALAAGATWDQIAAATGAHQDGARRWYREWADDPATGVVRAAVTARARERRRCGLP